MASSEFRREVENERKKLSREDFEAFQKETPAVKAKRYEDRAVATPDPQLKDHYLSIAKHHREIEAIQAVGDFASDDARERALELGPTLSQRIGWKLNSFSSHLKARLPDDLPDTILRIFFICAPILMVAILGKALSFGLGCGFALALFGSLGLFVVAKCAAADSGPKLAGGLMGLCVAFQLYTLFGQILAPQRGYIGIHEKNGQVVGLIDTSRESWMSSPGFFDTITWYEGIPEVFFKERALQTKSPPELIATVHRDSIDSEKLIYKQTEIGLSEKTKLVVSARKALNPEGLKKIHPAAATAGQSLGPYMMDIHQRFDEVVNASIPKEGEPMDLEALKTAILKLENDVWKIDEVYVAILQK